jgi:hypothetical protein
MGLIVCLSVTLRKGKSDKFRFVSSVSQFVRVINSWNQEKEKMTLRFGQVAAGRFSGSMVVTV